MSELAINWQLDALDQKRFSCRYSVARGLLL
jgi:hypothetical protein